VFVGEFSFCVLSISSWFVLLFGAAYAHAMVGVPLGSYWELDDVVNQVGGITLIWVSINDI